MPPCHEVFTLPEMITKIVHETDDRRTMFSCMLVNSVWAQETIAHLWDMDPSAENYLSLERPHRLQYYAKKVTYLGE